MSIFTQRSEEQELMDDLNSSGPVIDQTLRELEVINKLLGGHHVTLNGLEKLLSTTSSFSKPLKIADLGCGGGDMLKLIAQWARRKQISVELIGIDANPHVVNFARQNTRDFDEITFLPMDIFSVEFKSMSIDIATATLFTHHFKDEQLIKFFRQLKIQCRIGMVINDLHRHWLAYYSIKLLTAMFSKSEMVRNDAAVSVLRSFRKEEVQSLMNECDIAHYSLQWMWAFRWQLVAHFKKDWD